MVDSTDFNLGQHEARLDAIDNHLQAQDTRHDVLEAKIDRVLGYMERSKGSWKTLTLVGGFTVGFIEAAHQVVDWLHRGTHS